MLFSSERSRTNAVPFEADPGTVVDTYGDGADRALLETVDIRRGREPDGAMVTDGFHALVRTGEHYRLTERGLRAEAATFPLLGDLSGMRTVAPAHAEVVAVWSNVAVEAGRDANIFAKNGTLTVEAERIDVPVVAPDAASLAYYNAHYLTLGDGLQFGSEAPYSLCVMSIGERYVEDFLMREGGGQYLEFHDRPHFHWNLDRTNAGYYLLGKRIGDDRYHLTGFSIPYGAAVYTMPNALHADANLVGTNWVVGLTVAPSFATVLFRSPGDAFTRLNFVS